MSGKRLNKNHEWADLHESILLTIKGKLEAVDQLRFRGVCRNWRALSHVRSADKLPWLVLLRWFWESLKDRFIGYNLYDPSNDKEYFYGNELQRSSWYNYITVCGSKYGWVFVAVQVKSSYSNFFLFHAFTMKTIDLPASKVSYNIKGTFSTTPTSSDCVFCVITGERRRNFNEIRLYTCRTGDAKWTEFNIEMHGKELNFRDVIYRNGLIYCFFTGGLVWAFNIACHDWQQVKINASEITNIGGGYKENMVESNGEFLLVYYREDWKPWYIFKLDWSLMAWVKEVTLGNRALFLGKESLSVPTDGEIESLAGHIYFRGNLRYNYYDFKNNTSHRISKFEPLTCEDYFLKKFRHADKWVLVEPYL